MNEQELRQLYATPKNGCTHLSIPREGNYLIRSSHRRCYYNGLPLTIFAVWKPLGAKKSTPGIEVELPMLALILSNGIPFDDKLRLLSGDLSGYFLTVSEVRVSAHSQVAYNVEVKWHLNKIPDRQLLSKTTEPPFDLSDIIDGFLKDKDNLDLFLEPEIEELPDDDFDNLSDLDPNEPD